MNEKISNETAEFSREISDYVDVINKANKRIDELTLELLKKERNMELHRYLVDELQNEIALQAERYSELENQLVFTQNPLLHM